MLSHSTCTRWGHLSIRTTCLLRRGRVSNLRVGKEVRRMSKIKALAGGHRSINLGRATIVAQEHRAAAPLPRQIAPRSAPGGSHNRADAPQQRR